MRQYTFHLLGLAHLPTARKYQSCAFTQKNIKLAKMLTRLGHIVYLYGARSKEDPNLEEYINSDNFHFMETHTVLDIAKDYGTGDNRSELNYPWFNVDFKHDLNTDRLPSTQKFYKNTIDFINNLKKPDHFLLMTQGGYHDSIRKAVDLFLNCESGIGYRGSKKDEAVFRCFESSYIQNFTYGSEAPYASSNGSYYDRVIPNYFDPDDFEYRNKKGNYYLFIGRLIKRKGILTAYLATKALGAKLFIVGQGGYVDSRGHLVDNDPQEFDIPHDSDWEYMGFANLAVRRKLLAGAIATFVPTEYLECFAGTHIESMLSGTPPITTNFGVFPETIPNTLDGKVGFRCNTLQDFVDAAQEAKKVNHIQVRRYGERFSMASVALQYQRWFDDLYQVYLSTDGKTPGWRKVVIDSKPIVL